MQLQYCQYTLVRISIKVAKNDCNDVTFCMFIVRIEQLSRLDCFLINMVDNFKKVKPYNQLDMLNITNHHYTPALELIVADFSERTKSDDTRQYQQVIEMSWHEIIKTLKLNAT